MPTIRTIEIGGGQEKQCTHCKGTGRVKPGKKYRFVVDVGRGPDGKRRQRTYTFDRLKDAQAELARISHTTRNGEFVDRSKVTIEDMITRYLKRAEFEREENTKLSYRGALKPVRERLGHKQVQAVTLDDLDELRDWMLREGRKRGGKPGTSLSPRSVRMTFGRLSAVFDLAIKQRVVAINPVQYVEMPKQVKKESATWSAEQVQMFLAAASQDRLHAAWRLTLYGMRRGEVCGLRWSDIDLAGRKLTIANTRPVVAWEVKEKGPKSKLGARTLPLDTELVTALKALRKQQQTERLAAGPAYEDSGYLVTDQLGRPLHPDRYSRREFQRIRTLAGLPRITLHEERHTANSLMAAAGIPEHIRSAWCGHTVAVNKQTYTHARPEDLAQAAEALSKIHNAV